jgi:general L-amino acid transport system substrate-binding protein
MKRVISFVAALLVLMVVPIASFSGETLKKVRSKGVLRCGVSEGLPGFSIKDAKGRWTGIDTDFCRAVAAAVLGDPEKVDFYPLTASERLPALRTGEIDLLSRNTTWTIGREAGLGVQFVGTLYYDGQGFLVRKGGGITKISDLKNAAICIEKGTTSQTNIDDYFQSKGWKYKPIIFESLIKAQEAFFSGQCKAYTSDRSNMAAVRSGIREGSKTYIILPGQISKEPLGPVVRRGDEEWFTLVRWIMFALIEAEEQGVTQANVRVKTKEKDKPDMERFLGSSGNFGKTMGISNDWTVRIIESVGNYGEIFERNLGSGSPLGLDRGPNRLWNKGGLMYAPPFR